MSLRLLLFCCEPILSQLLQDRLAGAFDIVGTAATPDEAIAAARSVAADVILFDADLWKVDAVDLIAKISLVSPTPIVAMSSYVAPGAMAGGAMLENGARSVLPKGRGQLPLDLSDGRGEILVAALTHAVTS